MINYIKGILALLLLFFNASNSLNAKPKKIALVVGVAHYEYANPLNNTLNDANDISTKLKKLDFEVITLLDPTISELNNSISKFEKAIQNVDVCLVYYSGHGAEYAGENYLFAKDSNPLYPTDLQKAACPLGNIVKAIESATTNTSVIILDACRSNPFTKQWRSINKYEGLANIDIPMGTFIGFAASPGKTASDGAERNGTYTEAILKYIETKNISIDQLFNKVNKEVRIKSGGKQIPFKNSSLDDDFYFSIDSTLLKAINTIEPLHVNRPRFPMPSNIKGYSHASLNAYAITSINHNSFSPKDFIEIDFNPIMKDLWDKTTPIFVQLISTSNPKYPGGLMVYEEEFRQNGTNARIKLNAGFDKGKYDLLVGFYLLNELSNEYPPFYFKRYSINVLY